MAKAHVYVRVQVEGSNERVQAVAAAAAYLKSVVQSAAGSEWKGDTQLELDEESPPPADENPGRPVSDGGGLKPTRSLSTALLHGKERIISGKK